MLFFSRDLGIDLGTSNVLIYAAGRGIVLREPSVIALDKNSGKVLQVGAAARSMLGRTPGNVVAVHPLQDGVISDYELTARMLTEMLRRVLRHAIGVIHELQRRGVRVPQDMQVIEIGRASCRERV